MVIFVVTVLAASGHLAYGTLWFVSLLFPLLSTRAVGACRNYFMGPKSFSAALRL
jgi:ABC-type Fe3+-siderophore transport system permease subunit